MSPSVEHLDAMAKVLDEVKKQLPFFSLCVLCILFVLRQTDLILFSPLFMLQRLMMIVMMMILQKLILLMRFALEQNLLDM